MAPPKNIGDQIFDAVQDAVIKDFSALQSTIEYSVGLAAKNISKGLAHASRSMQQAQAEYQQEQEKRRQKQLMQAIYAKYPLKAVGYAMSIGGGVAAVPFLLGAAIVSTSGIAAFFVPPLIRRRRTGFMRLRHTPSASDKIFRAVQGHHFHARKTAP